MSSVASAAASITAADHPIRVMIVDDAIVVRRLLARWVDAESDLTVAACLRTGREAVEQVETIDPDVVVLDVEMPELTGFLRCRCCLGRSVISLSLWRQRLRADAPKSASERYP